MTSPPEPGRRSRYRSHYERATPPPGRRRGRGSRHRVTTPPPRRHTTMSALCRTSPVFSLTALDDSCSPRSVSLPPRSFSTYKRSSLPPTKLTSLLQEHFGTGSGASICSSTTAGSSSGSEYQVESADEHFPVFHSPRKKHVKMSSAVPPPKRVSPRKKPRLPSTSTSPRPGPPPRRPSPRSLDIRRQPPPKPMGATLKRAVTVRALKRPTAPVPAQRSVPGTSSYSRVTTTDAKTTSATMAHSRSSPYFSSATATAYTGRKTTSHIPTIPSPRGVAITRRTATRTPSPRKAPSASSGSKSPGYSGSAAYSSCAAAYSGAVAITRRPATSTQSLSPRKAAAYAMLQQSPAPAVEATDIDIEDVDTGRRSIEQALDARRKAVGSTLGTEEGDGGGEQCAMAASFAQFKRDSRKRKPPAPALSSFSSDETFSATPISAASSSSSSSSMYGRRSMTKRISAPSSTSSILPSSFFSKTPKLKAKVPKPKVPKMPKPISVATISGSVAPSKSVSFSVSYSPVTSGRMSPSTSISESMSLSCSSMERRRRKQSRHKKQVLERTKTKVGLSAYKQKKSYEMTRSDWYYTAGQLIELFDAKHWLWREGFVTETAARGRLIHVSVGLDEGGFHSAVVDLGVEPEIIRHYDTVDDDNDESASAEGSATKTTTRTTLTKEEFGGDYSDETKEEKEEGVTETHDEKMREMPRAKLLSDVFIAAMKSPRSSPRVSPRVSPKRSSQRRTRRRPQASASEMQRGKAQKRKEKALIELIHRRFKTRPPPTIDWRLSKLSRRRRLLDRSLPPPPLFGAKLSLVPTAKIPLYKWPIPSVVTLLSSKLDEFRAFTVPHIFDCKMSAALLRDLDELVLVLEHGEEATYDFAERPRQQNALLVAECLKLFVSQLPNALLSAAVGTALGAKFQLFADTTRIAEVLATIGAVQRSLLLFVADTCIKVVQFSDDNQMSTRQLAEVWMPILLFGLSELLTDEATAATLVHWFEAFVQSRQHSLQWA